MRELIALIDQKSENLKNEFIDQTILWAKEEHKRNLEKKDIWTTPQKRYKLFDENRMLFNRLQNWMKSKKKNYFNEEWFIEDSVRQANLKYQQAIEKLAYQIKRKGIDISKLEIKYGKVGRNIEVVFTDGVNKVTAQTILAWGTVNRPHYRYLVK